MKTSELIAKLQNLGNDIPFDPDVMVGYEFYEALNIVAVQHDPPSTLLVLEEAEEQPTNLHTTTRVPVNDRYAALVGKATYVFNYYEWTVIYLTDCLEPGFLNEYARGDRPMTSGTVAGRYAQAIANHEANAAPMLPDDIIAEMKEVQTEFDDLKEVRNHLLHAHPMTTEAGRQEVVYQGKKVDKRSQPRREENVDVQWSYASVEEVIQVFDEAAIRAGVLFDRLRQ